MRWHFMAVGLAVAAGLAGAGSRSRADDAKTYDLRGPAPEKGQVYVSKITMLIKKADTSLKTMGQTIKVKVTMNITGEEEQKILAVDGRNVTKSQCKVIKDRSEITTELGGQDMAQTEVDELEGEVIISDRLGENKWKHSLVDTKPSEKQKKSLDNRNGMENDDDLYPKEKIAVGHTWTVEAKALTKLFGNSFTDVTGQLKQKFLKVEEYEGEECAVIESTGKVKGKMKDEDGKPNLNVEMDLKVTSWRAVKTCVDLKEKFEGTMSLAGVQTIDGTKVDITMSGPLSGESTTRLKEAKSKE